MSKKPKGDLVRVQWLDIASSAGWKSSAEARKMRPIACTDVGWILERTPEYLIIYRSHNGDVGDVAVFPAGCVVSVTVLDAKEGA